MYRKSILMLIFSLVFTMTVMVVAVPQEATAAGVTMYADLDADTNYNTTGFITIATPTTWPELTTAVTDDVFFSFLASDEFATGDTLTLQFPSGWQVSSNCTAADTNDADADNNDDGTWNDYDVSGLMTYTFDDSTSHASNDQGVELCLSVALWGVTATNAAVILAGSNVPDDFGGVLLYVGDDNDVTVTANVTPVLRFEIRDEQDSTYTNTCALGYLSTTATSECKYRLKVYTNASDGYLVKITSDGDLNRTGVAGMTPDADDIDRATDGVFVLVPGNEGYGASLDSGACTYSGNQSTELGTWSTNDTPIPTSDKIDDFYTCNGANLPSADDHVNTALMTHVAAIDAGTQTGNYSQVVTYYVIARF